MNWRRLAVIVALAGVLLHTAAVVRHNVLTLAAALQQDTLATAAGLPGTGVICGYAGSGDPATAPAPSQPPKSASGCPICAGLTPGYALPVIDNTAWSGTSSAFAYPLVDRQRAVLRAARLVPPGRAPPA
jgi:hypothetical protein